VSHRENARRVDHRSRHSDARSLAFGVSGNEDYRTQTALRVPFVPGLPAMHCNAERTGRPPPAGSNKPQRKGVEAASREGEGCYPPSRISSPHSILPYRIRKDDRSGGERDGTPECGAPVQNPRSPVVPAEVPCPAGVSPIASPPPPSRPLPMLAGETLEQRRSYPVLGGIRFMAANATVLLRHRTIAANRRMSDKEGSRWKADS